MSQECKYSYNVSDSFIKSCNEVRKLVNASESAHGHLSSLSVSVVPHYPAPGWAFTLTCTVPLFSK